MLHRYLAILIFALGVFTGCDAAGPDESTSAAANSDSADTTKVASAKAVAEPDERMIDAVDSRQAVLTVLKDNFVPLALMAMGRIDYEAQTAQKYADRLPVMIGMLNERFKTDTRGSGVETEALDAIWEDMNAFNGKVSDAMDAANKLAAVASNEEQFNDAAMALRDRCGSCHDDFRVDND